MLDYSWCAESESETLGRDPRISGGSTRRTPHARVVQLAERLALNQRACGFKSHREYKTTKYAPLAQLVSAPDS